MRLADILRVIRAVRANDVAPCEVKIERLSSGVTNIAVKASGREMRAVAKRAQKAYDDLIRKYNGGK